jgi:uncharacterized membrane protein YkoI
MSLGLKRFGQNPRGFSAAVLAIAVAVAVLGVSPETGLTGEPKAFAAAKAKQRSTAPAAKVSVEEAKLIALKMIPGEVTSVEIEKKRGRQVYTVEIQNPDKGEIDVFVDVQTGEVVGTD